MKDKFVDALRRLQTMQCDIMASASGMEMDLNSSSTKDAKYIHCIIYIGGKLEKSSFICRMNTANEVENMLNEIKSIVYGDKRQSNASLASGAGNERKHWKAVG